MLIHQFVRTYVEDIWTHSTHLSALLCVCTVRYTVHCNTHIETRDRERIRIL